VLQVRVHGPHDVRLDEVDPPEPGPRDVVVRVAACGMCGSDLGYIRMGGLAGPGPEPLALGHELAGVVEWAGDEVDGLATGDRVVVHPGDDELGRIGNGAPEGGLAPRILVREAARGRRLFPIPSALPLEVAALAEPLAVGMRAVDQAEVQPGQSVAVFGCGPIGLAAVATLADRGITDVVAVDLSATRRELAAGLGARATLDPAADDVWAALAEQHGTTPFMFGPAPATDAFIEASGAPTVITQVVERARPGATLSVVAVHYDSIPVSFLLVLMKQLTIRGSMEYPPRFEDAVELLSRRDLSSMITHRFPLAQVYDALAVLSGTKDCGKVMVTMEEPGDGGTS
jgi:2-desacetyl-2-hydroxyethyl bacteriochlorophyllide A dehydrogenase